MNRPAPEGYLERVEYLDRLNKIQQAIHNSLKQNDQRFGGDDGIKAICVIGGHGKEYFRTSDETLVRKPSALDGGSDLDIIEIASHSEKEKKHLTSLDQSDFDLMANDTFAYPSRHADLIRRPSMRLMCLLSDNIRGGGLDIPMHAPLSNLNIDDAIAEAARSLNNPRQRLKFEAGLLFVPESEAGRSRILEIFRLSGLKIVVDPATTAEVLTDSSLRSE